MDLKHDIVFDWLAFHKYRSKTKWHNEAQAQDTTKSTMLTVRIFRQR